MMIVSGNQNKVVVSCETSTPSWVGMVVNLEETYELNTNFSAFIYPFLKKTRSRDYKTFFMLNSAEHII